MKTKIVSASALILLSSIGSAFAADLPTKKAPPVAAPAPLWKGLYVGLNAGGIWGNNSSIDVSTYPTGTYANSNPVYWAAGNGSVSSQSNNLAGFIGGGQVGYNWQSAFAGFNFVAGVEADIQGIAGTGGGKRSKTWLSLAGETDRTISNFGTASGSINYLGTVRGRLGWLVMPTLLVYGTGGLAYGDVNANFSRTQIESTTAGVNQWIAIQNASYANTQVGYSAGGGAEWMFMPNWSAKAEYLYYDLGNISTTGNSYLFKLAGSTNSQPFTSTAYTGRVNGNLVRAGVNYHFNWGSAPSPVVAKY